MCLETIEFNKRHQNRRDENENLRVDFCDIFVAAEVSLVSYWTERELQKYMRILFQVVLKLCSIAIDTTNNFM
jgi:hypothetical protein